MDEHMIGDYRAYPIYKISAKWDLDDVKYPHNFTSFSVMFHEEKTQTDMDEYARKWWGEYFVTPNRWSGKSPADKSSRLTSLETKFVEYETFCDVWFSHYTFNDHLTDAEVVRSFIQFVDRKQRIIYAATSQRELAPYCLMGAEDEYRWQLCRCEHCQQRGVVTIVH